MNISDQLPPDREYVDGEIRERNVGKWEHARLQWLLALWFGTHEKQWGITGGTEQRVRVSANRVRVPDLVVLTAGAQPDVLTDPPLLVIEILSPDDSYSDTQERAQDYREMGVETVWIIDPRRAPGVYAQGRNGSKPRVSKSRDTLVCQSSRNLQPVDLRLTTCGGADARYSLAGVSSLPTLR